MDAFISYGLKLVLSKQIWVVSPNSSNSVSMIPPFGFSMTNDPPFCSPKNQVIPPKYLDPRQAINNDLSLSYDKQNLVEHSVGNFHTFLHFNSLCVKRIYI